MQEHASAHVGKGDENHDDERSDEVALRPGLDDEAFGALGHGLVVDDVGGIVS